MFVLLAACAQAPVPLSLVARVLGVQPDNRELEDICSCPLLLPPTTVLGDVQIISVHQVTRSVFKEIFLSRNASILAGKADVFSTVCILESVNAGSCMSKFKFFTAYIRICHVSL